MSTATANRDEQLLLRFLREPESLIESVEETCEVGGTLLRRRLDIKLSAAANDGESYVYVDIVHPDKGLIHKVSLDESHGAEIVDHDTHRELARAMIFYRLGTLLRSLKMSPGAEHFVLLPKRRFAKACDVYLPTAFEARLAVEAALARE